MQLKTVLNNFLLIISFSIIFSYQFDGTGYSNIYAINKLSNKSLIKLPFRLLSYDLTISDLTSENNISIHANGV